MASMAALGPSGRSIIASCQSLASATPAPVGAVPITVQPAVQAWTQRSVRGEREWNRDSFEGSKQKAVLALA